MLILIMNLVATMIDGIMLMWFEEKNDKNIIVVLCHPCLIDDIKRVLLSACDLHLRRSKEVYNQLFYIKKWNV